MPRNTRTRKWVYVVPFSGVSLNYGFRSGLEESLMQQFGQTPIAANTPVQNLIIKPNNCRPARATRIRTTGSEGSFCGHSVVAALRTAGYKITPGQRPKQRRSSARSTILYVTINGIKYGWNSPNTTMDLSGLGHKVATGSEDDIIFGSNFPKPPRARKTSTSGEDTVSSFIDPTGLETATTGGWLVVTDGRYTAQHLAESYAN